MIRLAGPTATIQIQGTTPVTIEAGTLLGAGNIDGSLVNGSTVTPFGGDIVVTGNYEQEADAELALSIDGNQVEELDITGCAALNGTLSLSLDGAAPTQSLWLVSYASHAGVFSTIDGGEACAEIEYQPTAVMLLPQPCVVVGSPAAAAQIVDDDLGFGYEAAEIPARGSFSWLGAINDTYVVGTTNFGDADTEFAYYYNHTSGSFAYWGDVLAASDINDSNELVGTCGETLGGWSCFRSEKVNYRLPQLPSTRRGRRA